MEMWSLEIFFVFLLALIPVTLLLAIGYYFQLHHYLYCIVLKLPFPNQILIRKHISFEMEDKILLFADMYLPVGNRTYPTILMRTPYGKDSAEHNYPLIARIFAGQGYIVIIQDVRGKYSSEGIFRPFLDEEKDGKETITQIGKFKESNGKVALWGFSYLGSCAWLTTPESSPELKTIIPINCCQNAYMGWIDRGVPYLKDILMWLSKHHGKTGRIVSHEEVDKMILRLPVLEFDKRLEDGIGTFKTWMYHLHSDEYWRTFSVSQRRNEIRVPVLFMGGWFDRFVNNTVDDYIKTLGVHPGGKPAASRLVIGPWGHIPTYNFPFADFGRKASFRRQFRAMIAWLNHIMYDTPYQKFPVEYFMMGLNEWRYSNTWPPEQMRFRSYFLRSEGNANTFFGNGSILSSEPDNATEDHYIYEPENPVPSLGNRMLYGNETDGPCDQTPLYERKDILFYRSFPLVENLEIAGPIKAVIYMSSSAVDTDFAVKLCDLHPDNKSYYLINGYVRMRFLDTLFEKKGIERGAIYRIEVFLGHTAHTFLKDHRLLLQITSSDFPNHERNLNTGRSNERDSEKIKAYQTIYCGGDYLSHLILPVLK